MNDVSGRPDVGFGETPSEVCLSEVLGALSYALDLTEGQPTGHAVRCCLLGTRIGRELGLDPDALSDLYYALLLKDAGCSANAARTAELFASDDHRVKRRLKTVDWTRWVPAALYGFRNTAAGRSLPARLLQTLRVARGGRRAAAELVRIRCERGASIADKLGFPARTAEGIQRLDEHWDGAGNPDGIRGPEIPLVSRIALLAQTLDVFVVEGDRDEALRVVRERSGTWFDPSLVEIVRAWDADEWWTAVYGEGARARLKEAEPSPRPATVGPEGLDRIAEGFAEIIDAKSPFTFRHSTGVADYAVGLARRLGFAEREVRPLRHAALLHDIGKLAVSNLILDKPGRLTDDELAIVKRHPIHTWTILSHVDAFAPIAGVAALHHERLDGRGYPWGFGADRLEPAARVIAVADVYEALTADRPYRRPLDRDGALALIEAEAGLGFDADVVEALAELTG